MTAGFPERTRPESCLSDLTVERLLASELTSAAERGPVEAHLAGCALCRRRRDELAAAPALQPDPRWWAAQLDRPAPPRRRSRSALGAGLLVFMAVAATLLLVLLPRSHDGDGDGDTRTKGPGLALELVARRIDGQVEPVLEATVLHPGDAIRFIVTAALPGELAIVGMDAAGHTSVYFPLDGAAASFEPGRRDLPGSVVLDETLGDERLQLLLCPSRPPRDALVAAGQTALARAGNLPTRIDRLDLSCRQTGLSIHKERHKEPAAR